MVLQQLDQHEEVKVQKLQQAFQLWRDDLQKQLPTGKLKSIESKLAALEGSVLSAGDIHTILWLVHRVYGL